MIASLFGQIIHHQDNWLILEAANGVGYKVYVGSMPEFAEKEVRLFTYHHIREDASDLYGFTSVESLAFFELLLTVSGVGPKMAQNLINQLGSQTIIEAVSQNQPQVFRSVSGIGQRVAEKIIVELKSKVSGLTGTGSSQLLGSDHDEVMGALLNLGYRPAEIMSVLREIDPSLSTSQKIKQGLRLLTK